MGYVGGALLLVLNLAFYLSRESLGVSTSTAVRVCLFSAGLWWALFVAGILACYAAFSGLFLAPRG